MATKALLNQEKKRRTPRIEIIPMVDVMFLLLVFYILSSLALHKPKGIAVDLPNAKTGDSPSVSQDLTVTITADGSYYLDKEKVPEGRLDESLKLKCGGSAGRTSSINVVINADQATPHHYVVAAMDSLRNLGVTNFSISTVTSGAKR